MKDALKFINAVLKLGTGLVVVGVVLVFSGCTMCAVLPSFICG